MDIMINKLDRNTAEMVALRSEIGSIKAKVCGEIRKPKVVLPCQPLTTIDELDHFEHNLQEESFFKNVIAELMMSGEKAFDKWIRSSWRSIVSDEVARQCSWRGTEEKKCIRGLRVTLAIRTYVSVMPAMTSVDKTIAQSQLRSSMSTETMPDTKEVCA
ncbi:GL16675 [Drosophila persimilis]|uniref:GL16675 n=1 Tax=Drosophila persimilis TaxID=7234 RepID=B4IR55_DROPE|nr:GL16675 [Drosophila persimilis]